MQRGRGRLRPAECFRAQGAAITFEGARECGGKKQHEERVQAQSLYQVAMQQRGEGSGSAASRAKDAEVLVDGADRVEACPIRRVEQQRAAQQQRERKQRMGKASVPTEVYAGRADGTRDGH